MTEHMMKARHRTLIGISILAGFTAVLAGQGAAPDWPQWRGPNRDGAVASFEEPASWPALLTLRWKVEVGLGYATPIVVDNRVYMFARQTGPFTRQTGNEVMLALDADTGKAIWQTGYPALFSLNSIMGPVARSHREGPKSTPTFANGRLYTLGMTGVVTALDAATGQQLWQKPASPVLPLYHTAMSPLVDRGLVILHVGGHDQGALTAFDAITGDVKWSWNGDGPAYASPIVAEFESVRQVITFTQDNLIGVAAATGELLWRRPFATQGVQNIITPILYGQTVIVSGTGKGVTAFRVTRQDNQWVTENAWDNQEVSLYMSNAVIARDALFGLSERNSGQYFALDAKTGKTLWTSDRRQATNAAIVGAGDVLWSLEDDGELVVARSSLSRFEPVRRYQVADSATWAQPVISGNRVFVKDVSSLALWTLK